MSINKELSLRLSRRRLQAHDEISKKTGFALRLLVQQCKMTQREFAEVSKLHQAQVSHIITGRFQQELLTIKSMLSAAAVVKGNAVSYTLTVKPDGSFDVKTTVHE